MQRAATRDGDIQPGALRRLGWLVGVLLALMFLLGGAPVARAAEPELVSFELTHGDDGVFLSYAVNLELSRSVDDALSKAVPLFFVRRSRAVPQPLLLARPAHRLRDKALAHRVPAAHHHLPRHVRRWPEPELHDPRRGFRCDQPAARAGRSPKAHRSTRAAASMSSSASSSTPRSCRDRCRSASAARRTGRCRFSATQKIN